MEKGFFWPAMLLYRGEGTIKYPNRKGIKQAFNSTSIRTNDQSLMSGIIYAAPTDEGHFRSKNTPKWFGDDGRVSLWLLASMGYTSK